MALFMIPIEETMTIGRVSSFDHGTYRWPC